MTDIVKSVENAAEKAAADVKNVAETVKTDVVKELTSTEIKAQLDATKAVAVALEARLAVTVKSEAEKLAKTALEGVEKARALLPLGYRVVSDLELSNIKNDAVNDAKKAIADVKVAVSESKDLVLGKSDRLGKILTAAIISVLSGVVGFFLGKL